MSLFRKTRVTPLLAMILMATVMAAQAAGCCKLGDLMGVFEVSPTLEAVSLSADTSPAMDAHGSCCPASKPSRTYSNPGETAVSDCSEGEGCCLKNSDLNEDKILQALFQNPSFPIVFAYVLTSFVEEPGRNTRLDDAKPDLGGPPIFLLHRQLLI